MNEFNSFGGYGRNQYLDGYRDSMTRAGDMQIESRMTGQGSVFQNGSNQFTVPQTSNIPWIQVPNIEAARNIMIRPNQTAYMMNQNAPEFYVKTADAMGVATIKFYKFEEYNPETEIAVKMSQAQTDNFVTLDQFNSFVSSVSSELESIKKASSSLVKVEEKKETSKGGK